jgi:hypothetical protein
VRTRRLAEADHADLACAFVAGGQPGTEDLDVLERPSAVRAGPRMIEHTQVILLPAQSGHAVEVAEVRELTGSS